MPRTVRLALVALVVLVATQTCDGHDAPAPPTHNTHGVSSSTNTGQASNKPTKPVGGGKGGKPKLPAKLLAKHAKDATEARAQPNAQGTAQGTTGSRQSADQHAAPPAPQPAPQAPSLPTAVPPTPTREKRKPKENDEEWVVRLRRLLAEDVRKGFELVDAKHAEGVRYATFVLADSKLHGDHVDGHDVVGGLALLRQAADMGSPHAHHSLAIFHTYGLFGFPKDEAKAVLHLTFGASGGSESSQLALANRHDLGAGVQQSCAHAARLITDAFEAVQDAGLEMVGDPMFRLNEDLQYMQRLAGEDRDIVDFYRFSARHGDVHAQAALGTMFLRGTHVVEPNPDMARQFLEDAAANGDVAAFSELGDIYLKGIGVAQNNDTAFEYFSKGAKRNDAASLNGLGYMHLHGMGRPPNTVLGVDFLRKATERGSAEAHYNLGMLYLGNSNAGGARGVDVARDVVKALRHFSSASAAGHALSTFRLSQLHLQGLGTQASCPLALKHLWELTEQGPWSGLLSDALHKYLEGNLDSALVMYLDAAAQGYSVGSFNAAYLLHNTGLRSVEQTTSLADGSVERVTVQRTAFSVLPNDTDQHALALQLFEDNAASGNTEALIFLGDIHFYGMSVAVDMAKAANLYRAAADARHPQAMYNIGYMHQHGLGVTKDFHLAKRHFDQVGAAHHGSRAASVAALAVLGVQWVVEGVGEHADADYVLVGGLLTLLLSVVLVLVVRRRNR